MQISKATPSPTQVSLKLTAHESDLEPIKSHVISSHFSDVKVPGFREGKAPLSVIEKSIDQNRLANEFIEHAINELYRRAISDEKLRPVGQPKIEIKKFVPFTILEFEVTQDIVGAVKLPDYKRIKLPHPNVTVSAQDVSNVIESLRQRMAEKAEVKRPAKIGDEVIIDFKGADSQGKSITGADGRDYPLVLGSGSFIPGFEDKLVGLTAGEKKKFDLTFPKDYGVVSLRSKKVTFQATLKKVNELALPKLDDAFAKKAGPFKTTQELKQDIKKQLLLEREGQNRREYENELIRTIASKTTIDIPDSLIDEQILQMENAEKQNLTYRGQTWEDHLKEEGLTEAQHRERQKPEAVDRVKGGLVLSEVASQEDIEVSEAELNDRTSELKQQYSDEAMRKELDKPENRQDILARILTEKTIAKLVDYASK